MQLLVLDNYQLMSAKAADLVIEQINAKPRSVLALPTGRTPLGLYQELVDELQRGEISLNQLTIFNLDEYVGLGADHPASYAHYLQKNFLSQTDILAANIYLLDGAAPDVHWVCDDYERTIQEIGGLDLAILGLGLNGHIAYNEPGGGFNSRTHVVKLTESSRRAALGFANLEAVPREGLTMGLETIMAARQIMLLVSGADKKDILQQALHGPVSPAVPASILQTHSQLTVVMDKAAAS